MNRMHTVAILVVPVCISILICFLLPHSAGANGNVEVIKIAHQDGIALIRADSDTLKVVHVGDNLPPLGTIEAINKGSIVFKNKNLERIILKFKNGKQHIQRIGKFDSKRDKPTVVSISTPDVEGNDVGIGKAAPPEDHEVKK
jgi:hypothetical protein